MHFKSASALLLTLGCCFSLPALAAADPLVGTWKTIDDRTGYSLSDVEISKGKDNHYSAKIINTRAVPGAAAHAIAGHDPAVRTDGRSSQGQ